MAPKKTRDPKTHAGAALGELLHDLRSDASIPSQDAMAKRLQSTLSVAASAETGQFPPTDENLATWLDICGVEGRHREAIEALWHIAKAKENPGRQRVAPWYETEAEAHTLMYWATTVVPGIAQDKGYAEELYRMETYQVVSLDEFLTKRLDRQKTLVRESPPDVTIVLWEPVLDHPIGSSAVMMKQMKHLLELSELPNVHMQVRRGTSAGLGGSINLAMTETTEILLVDGFSEDFIVGEAARIRRAVGTFNSVRANARPEDESRILITEAMERWSKSEAGGSPATAARQTAPTASR